MTIDRRRFIGAGVALFAGRRAVAKASELARILVPFAVGGTLDLIARQLAEAMRGDLADNIVVENKAGAAGRIAIDTLRLAPPDGTTMLIHAGGIQSLYPYIFKQLSYAAFTDVAPVSLTNRLEFGFALSPAVPPEIRSLQDYLGWVRRNPAMGGFGTPGSGTPLHFLPMLMGRDSNVELQPVHFRGTGAAWPEFLGGQIPALSAPLHDLVQQLPTGKVRIIANSGKERSRLTPQVATYAEQGFPQLTSGDWYGVYVSGKTPVPVQEQLSASVRKALASPSLTASFAKMFIEPVGSTPAEALSLARADSQFWSGMIKAVGYSPE